MVCKYEANSQHSFLQFYLTLSVSLLFSPAFSFSPHFSSLLLSPFLRTSLHLDLLTCPASFFLNLVKSSFLPTLSSLNTKFNSPRISDYLYRAASADGSVVFVLRRPRNNRDGPKPRTLSDIVGMYQPSSFSLFM